MVANESFLQWIKIFCLVFIFQYVHLISAVVVEDATFVSIAYAQKKAKKALRKSKKALKGVKQLSEAVEVLESQVDALETENAAQQTTINSNTATNTAQDSAISANTATNTAQDTAISSNTTAISANTATNTAQDSAISANTATNTAQDTAISVIQTAVSNLSLGVDDDADGVEITFIREYAFDSGNGIVPALDLNGTNLIINQTDPIVSLGGQILNVLEANNIPNTNPLLQQVIVDLPSPLFAGQHKLKLNNDEGKSNVFIHITGTVDTSLPVITLIGSNSVNVSVGTNYVDAGAVAIDAEDGDISADITTSGLPIDTSAVGGPFTITYNVSDSSGNAAAPVERTVTVNATYSWQASAFGSCSVTCGGGTQTRNVSCQRNDGVTVIDSFCTGTKPPTSQSCNTQSCYTGIWTLSSQSCSTSTLNVTYTCVGGTCNPNTKPAGTVANGCREGLKDFLLPDARGDCSGSNWSFIGANNCTAIIGGHSVYSTEGTRVCGCSNFGIVWDHDAGTVTGGTPGQQVSCNCRYYCPKRNCSVWVPK